MKVMVMVKASPNSEAGVMPSEALMAAMGSFNEALVEAGIMASGDGLKPSSEGYRVRFDGQERTVTRGPFAETSELVAGYWIWNVSSMEEALEWVKKCPNPMEEEPSDIEIRTFYELEDFAEADTDGEFRDHENALRQQVDMQQAPVTPYLLMGGQCEAAQAYYTQHLGARVEFKMLFNESPDAPPEGMLAPGFENKVMHSSVKLGKQTVMMSDGCSEADKVSNASLAISLTSEDTAHTVFDALADGGKVTMPLTKTFWSPLFGQVTDRFGVSWMVSLPGPHG